MYFSDLAPFLSEQDGPLLSAFRQCLPIDENVMEVQCKRVSEDYTRPGKNTMCLISGFF